jgi:hypothetical protein
MKNIFPLLVLATLFLVSCKKTETTDDIVVDAEPETTIDSVVTPPQTVPAATTPNSVMYNTPNTSTTTTTPAAPAAVTTAPGMNPPHGQPGHNCGIPVGAPLNTAAKPAAAPQQSKAATITSASTTPGTVTNNGTTVTTVNNNAATTPTVTAPGMNPPHGAEGHVCSVAVGAPLPK